MNEDEELLAVFRDDVRQHLNALVEMLGAPREQWDPQRLFSLSHNIKGACRMMGFDDLSIAAHAIEDVFGAIRSTGKVSNDLHGFAQTGALLLQACFDHLSDNEFGADVASYRAEVTRHLEQLAAAAPAPTKDTRARRRKVSKQVKEDMEQPQGASESGEGDETQVAPAQIRGRTALSANAETIRISVDKLEAVTELGTEFIALGRSGQAHRDMTAQLVRQLARLRHEQPNVVRSEAFRQLEQLSRRLHRGLAQDGSRGQRLSAQLEEAVRLLRMVHLDTIGSILRRALSSAANERGCKAELRIEGGEAELDRLVLESLSDPLIHLVRNAVAHGLESPADRVAAGKPEVGLVTLTALSSGSWLDVVVKDDGRGMDENKIRAQAQRKGLITPAEAASRSRQDVLDLVFTPGFSTADQVSELAGRGVGMDVVRTNLLNLGGSVSISSTLGKGTEVRLRAPLTRLTARGIVARIGEQLVAVPTLGIERAIVVRRADIRLADGEEMIALGDRLVAVGAMADALGLPASASEESPALVLTDAVRLRALLVDDVIGEKEFTVQPLPWNLPQLPGLAGATVFEGGEIALVINVAELVWKTSTSRGGSTLKERNTPKQYKILVVDDSVTSRTLEKNILSAAGYDVQTAVDGALAYSLLLDGNFDLVVTDVEMPNMNGFELTRKIRSSSRLGHLPVVLVTSLGDEADISHGAEAGANAHIVKGTFDQDALLSVVADLL